MRIYIVFNCSLNKYFLYNDLAISSVIQSPGNLFLLYLDTPSIPDVFLVYFEFLTFIDLSTTLKFYFLLSVRFPSI